MNVKFTIMSLLLCTSGAAMAQTAAQEQLEKDKKSTHVISIDGEKIDSVTQAQLINQFYTDQFRHFQDPRAPYFMFMSKSKRLAMGIGGVVRMRAWYDWGGAMPNSGFIPYNISIDKDPTRDHWYGTTPAGTALFFSVFGTDKSVGSYRVYIEANFNGYNSKGFQLKKAYATVEDWTIGYTNSSFEDPAAQPPTVDAQGPNAECGASNMLLRWMHTMKSRWSVALSAETPSNSIPILAGKYTGCSTFMPDIAGFVQYEWAANNHLRLSGIVRGLEYRNLVVGANRKVAGWGTHLSTVFNPTRNTTVYGMALVGKGIGSLNNDLQCGQNDLIGLPDGSGRMTAPLSFGWYGAFQYHFSPSVFSTIIFSEERFLPKHQPVADNLTYKYGLYATANVFWYFAPRCMAGIEYNWGQRRDIDHRSGSANRVSMVAQFSF